MSRTVFFAAFLWASMTTMPFGQGAPEAEPPNTIPTDQIEVQLTRGKPAKTAVAGDGRVSDMVQRVLDESKRGGSLGLQRFTSAHGIPFVNELLPVIIVANDRAHLKGVEKVVTRKGGKIRSIFEENAYAEVSIKALRLLAVDKRIERIDLDIAIYQPLTPASPKPNRDQP